jgi:hypothetical protein
MGGAAYFACCRCVPDLSLDGASSVLYNMDCPIHGPTWHRKMIRLGDGSEVLVYQISPHLNMRWRGD